MKCQEFNSIARDLARHQLFGELCDAGLRAQAEAHIAECAQCAARLADEHSLAAGLRVLASQDQSLAAPIRVETALLTAFRQQTLDTAPSIMPLRPRAPRWVWAAAAVLMISLFTLGWRWLSPNQQQATDSNGFAAVTPTASATQNQSATARSVTTTNQQAAPRRAPSHKVTHKQPRQRERIERYLVESEIATDFLPLVDASRLARPERLQIIRVEVPRVALASFGLPMSFERAIEPVQADLVVGSDGVTRAIRFVQNSFEPAQIISANHSSSANEKER
jgi:hypothetical protein